MCEAWYDARQAGTITSTNFQLHPPRGKDTNVITNTYGNLVYPLLLCAERKHGAWALITYQPGVMQTGLCEDATPTNALFDSLR
jgi:hypothetical protein